MWTNAGASRTLDPSQRSFASVVGLHEKQLSDADVNLIQSVADWKRRRALKNTSCSGPLSYAPFTFTARTANVTPLSFSIPAFDILMNGDLITIGGNNSADLTQNVVTIPQASFWFSGSASDPISLYVVYVECWYQRVNPSNGLGYFTDAAENFLYYPLGCVNAAQTNLIPNDALDPFENPSEETTERVQLQWAIRVTQIDPAYDFTKYAFGLDAGATSAQTVYAQAGQPDGPSGAPYQFINQASVSGDSGIWRAGDGNYLNELATVDGYSYAMPLAVIMQRNLGVYAMDQNPFGTVTGGGAPRPDGKVANVIYPEDVVDTRSAVSLKGWDTDKMLRQGFVDIISGQTRTALARGESPGSSPLAVGSMLDYNITVAPHAVANTDTVGTFDGCRNGFAAIDQTNFVTRAVSVNQKVVGTVGTRWSVGDSISLILPTGSPATISSVQVQALVNTTGQVVQFVLGQLSVVGLGTQTVTVAFIASLTGTPYDAGLNPLYVTMGVEYPASGGMDLVKVPSEVAGGLLIDGTSSQSMPVFAVSDYAISAPVPTAPAGTAYAYSPTYSDVIFGTRVQLNVHGSTGSITTAANGNFITTFSMTRTGLPANLTGLYAVSAVDLVTGSAYSITARSLSGSTHVLQVQGAVPSTSTVVVTFLAANTAQLSYCAPVKGVTAIEETVLVGTATDPAFPLDSRIAPVLVTNVPGQYNTVVLVVNGGTLTGIAGDDVNKLVWVKNTQGGYDAVQVGSTVLSGGFAVLTIPATVNLQVQPFFLVASLLPAFASTSLLSLTESYVPYQGEGVMGRDYEIVRTENQALVTTNGTGIAPVPGLADVYPYNRELPISTTLPSQVAWSDQTLLNEPVASYFDSNFVATAFQNVEHTVMVPVHSNDFIESIGDDKRKSFQLTVASGNRGFAKATPHVGFAIAPVAVRTAVVTGVTSTSTSVVLYVNNVTGNDSNDGLNITTPFLTITAALKALPSVLRHPCSIQLVPTGTSYMVSKLSTSLDMAALGDGVIRTAKYYALGVLDFTIQESGRLVVTALAGTAGVVTIDATGWAGFGDGPTSAFFIQNSRAMFNQIEFKGFTNPAVKGLAADAEFINCLFTNNQQATSFEQGSTVIQDGGTILLASGGVGFVLSQSSLDASNMILATAVGASPGPFYEVERGSDLTLDSHLLAQESNLNTGMVIAEADLNSSIVVTPQFASIGQAVLTNNSVLSRTAVITPFSSVNADASSNVTTSI